MKIALLGDIALVGQFNSTITNNVDARIQYLRDLLLKYDYVVANLESPLTARKKTVIPKSMHLRADTSCVKVLKMLGVNAVTLANNHIYDFGRYGLQETIHTLEQEGIKWFGIDGNSIIEIIKGERVSFSGFCCLSTNGFGYQKKYEGKGVNILTKENLVRQLKLDSKNNALSILSLHWGIEHTNYPGIEHIKLAESISEEKPIVIHGHHPHQIQGIQNNNQSVIAYSLGNALFDKTTSINGKFAVNLNEENRKSFVLGVEIINGEIIGYETNGFYIGEGGIEPYNVLPEINEISKPLKKITDSKLYQDMRKKQYQDVLDSKFGKHDIDWLKSRMNYYSFGAKITSIIREKKYKRVKKKFYS